MREENNAIEAEALAKRGLQNFLNMVPFVCSMMVIGIHQYNATAERTSFYGLIEGFFSHGIFTAAVPTFMFLSGYLFYRNVNSYKDVFSKQKKRIGSVLMPYLAWSAIYYLFVAMGSAFHLLNDPVEISWMGAITGIVFHENCYFLWFMFQLCIYVALAPIIFTLLKSKPISVLALVSVVIVGMIPKTDIVLHYSDNTVELFQFEIFSYYLMGCIVATMPKFIEKIASYISPIYRWILPAIFLASGLFEALCYEGIIPVWNKRCLVPFVFVAFVLMMLQICMRHECVKRPKSSTMILYGVHSLIGIVLNNLIMNRIALHNLAEYFICFVAVTGLSLAAAVIIKRIPFLHKILSGNR